MKRSTMKTTRKLLVMMICLSMAAASLAGCSSSSSTAAETTAAEASDTSATGSVIQGDDAASFYGTTLMGSVTAVDGSTITMNAMAGMGDGQMPSGDMNGQAPSGDSSAQAPSGNDGQQPPAMPSGDGSTDGSASADDGNSSADTSGESASADESAASSDSSQASGDTNSQPPAMPDGQAPSGDSNGQAPSGDSNGQAPSGDNNGQSPSGDNNGQAPSGDSNGQAPSGDSSQTPPEKPSGDANASDDSSQASDDSSQASGDSNVQAPSGDGSAQAPSGDSNGQAPSGDGNMQTPETSEIQLVINDESLLKDSDGNAVELSSITEGSFLTVTVDESGNITAVVVGSADSMGQPGGQGGQMGQPGGGSSSGVDSYDSANNYTEDTTVSDETLDSTGTDENTVLVSDGATATLENDTITKTSSDSTGGDNSSFYGVGAAVLTTDGTTYVDGGTITTDSAGGAGVFSYGDGTTYVSGTTITTKQDTSGGIHVAGGGKLYCYDADVTTNGESSAAIRSDRGGGTMVVDGGTYTSNGVGSPAIYCTADITAHNAQLTATGSEALCIEGLNTVRLFDCDLTGNMSDSDQNDCTWNIILYQSMSGDSEVGNSTLDVEGGSITAGNGGLIYTTNTECTIRLSQVDITYADDSDFFLKVTGNSNARGWGSSGANGSQCTFTADDQDMEGDVIWDSISTLDFYMENGSTLTGAIVDDESNAGNGGSGYANLTIDSGSTWTVTGDSTLTSLNNAGTIVDADGKTVSIVGTDGTEYVKGDSAYTITVGSYSTDTDLSGATAEDSFDNYAVENPMAS